MAVNKIIYSDDIKIDLSEDNVIAAAVQKGYYFHDRHGLILEGTNVFDANTKDANAIPAAIVDGYTAYVNGEKVRGTIPKKSNTTAYIENKTDSYQIPYGVHDGSTYVELDPAQKALLIPQNIKNNVTVLGVTGEYGGEECVAQEKTVTPQVEAFDVQPDPGYTHLTVVHVNAIPYREVDNEYGTTIIIG